MRAIKKTIKTTVVEVFEPDMNTMSFKQVGGFDIVGGLGERLCVSRAKRESVKTLSSSVTTSSTSIRWTLIRFLSMQYLPTMIRILLSNTPVDHD